MAEHEELDLVTKLASEYQIITEMDEDAIEATALQFVRDFGQLVDDFYNEIYEEDIEELIGIDYWSNELAYNPKLSKGTRSLLKKCNKKFHRILDEIGLDLDIYIKSC